MAERDAKLIALLRRDSAIVAAALALLTGLAWLYVIWLAAEMQAGMQMAMPDGTSAMLAPGFTAWSPGYFLAMFAMWSVMMVGMMTPSVAPMVLLYTQVARQAKTLGKPFAPAAWFAGGYLLAWTAFSLVATFAQWALDYAGLLTPMMASASDRLGGAILIAAGLYQWTPFKDRCLTHCRAPLSFVQRHGGFKNSATGSLRLGFLHGGYCVGCCWALMALLFAGGVMNLLWIAALMILVLAEKVLPQGRMLSRLAGLAAVGTGLWLAAGL